MLFKALSLGHIVKKSVRVVKKQCKNRRPAIHKTDYYGAVEMDPALLAVWFFFKTDEQLERAKACGLTDEIQAMLFGALKENGYPLAAFTGVTNPKLKALTNKVAVAFGSCETVERDYKGNYFLFYK